MKAEFDSLKNDFQSQIDQYNTSIDSKIDGAIASYLSGVVVERKVNLKILIGNYDDIFWLPNFKIYARHKEWDNEATDQATYELGWFVPHADRRLSIAGAALAYNSVSAWGPNVHLCNLSANITGIRGPLSLSRIGGYVGMNGYSQVAPVFCLKRTWSDELAGFVIDANQIFRNNFGLSTGINTFVHQLSGGDRNIDRYLRDNPIAYVPGTLVFNDVSGDSNKLLDFSYQLRRYNNASQTALYTDAIKLDQVGWPTMYYTPSAALATGFNDTVNAWPQSEYNRPEFLDYSVWFGAGVNWYYMSNYYDEQCNVFSHGLFGRECDALINTLDEDIRVPAHPQIRNAVGNGAGAGVVLLEFVRFNVQNGSFADPSRGEAYAVVSIDGAGSMPIMPVASVSQLMNVNFSNGAGGHLKMGQGMPILLNSDYNGNLIMEFETEIGNTIGSSVTNKNITFSIKNSDFLDKKNDYVTGTVNDTASEKELKNVEIDSSKGKVKVSIPIKNEANLWFRMAPNDDSGGYYAKMKNLKLEVVTD